MLKPLNLFLSFFWKHLYTSKKSQPIDTVLIFTSPKWSFSIPTQRAKRDPREPARHDSTAVYLIAWGRDDLCPLTGPEGLVYSLKCLKCWSLESALEATWTLSHTQIQTHRLGGFSPSWGCTSSSRKFESKQLLVNGKPLNLCGFIIGGPSSLQRTFHIPSSCLSHSQPWKGWKWQCLSAFVNYSFFSSVI